MDENELTFEDKLRRAVNIVSWEKWEAFSTDEILAVIFNSLGETEKVNTLTGEVLDVYVIGRSRA